jgi:hypothetical protein
LVDPAIRETTWFYQKARNRKLTLLQEVQNEFFTSFPLIIPGQQVETTNRRGIEYNGKLLFYRDDFVALDFQGRTRYIPTRDLTPTLQLRMDEDLRMEMVELEAALRAYEVLRNEGLPVGEDQLPLYLSYKELLEVGYPDALLNYTTLREEMGDYTYAFFAYGLLARREIPEAIHALGNMYAQGLGMPANLNQALRLLEKSKAMAHPESEELIQVLREIQGSRVQNTDRGYHIVRENIEVPCDACTNGFRASLFKSGSGQSQKIRCTVCQGTGTVQKRIYRKVETGTTRL